MANHHQKYTMYDMQIDVKKKVAEITRLRTEVADAQHLVEDYRKKHVHAITIIKGRDDAIKKLALDREKLAKSLSSEVENRNKVLGNAKALRKQVDETTQQISALEQELDDYGNELSKEKSDKRKLADKLDILKDEKAKLRAQLLESLEEEGRLADKVDELDHANAKKDQKLKKLIEQNDQLTTEVLAGKELAVGMETKLSEAATKLGQAKSDAELPSMDVSWIRSDMDGLKSHFSYLTMLIDGLPQRIEETVTKKVEEQMTRISQDFRNLLLKDIHNLLMQSISDQTTKDNKEEMDEKEGEADTSVEIPPEWSTAPRTQGAPIFGSGPREMWKY